MNNPAPETLTLNMIRQQFLPLGARTIYRMISAKEFPEADIRIGGKVRLWKRETIEDWISEHAGRKGGVR